ncbi:hypothetical protein Tco_1096800 [Tanacetum coccineum]
MLSKWVCVTTATTEKSSEDGGNLEELILTPAVDKGDFTRPILAVKEDLGQKLIDDLNEPLILLESYGMINKNEFADGDVAPVVAVTPVEQSSVPLGRIKQNQAEHHKIFIWQIILKLGYEICLVHLLTNARLKQEPVPAQRKTWDPRITQYDVLKQHLKDKSHSFSVSSSHSKVSSMMASIDEDVEKSSLADQDDVGSGKVKSLKKNDLIDMLVPRMLRVLLLIKTYKRREE